jgi:hypothetical protein
MLILVDRAAEKQLWQVSLRGKGRGVRLRKFRLSASGEEFLQKLEHIIVPFEREEAIHLTDINAGVKLHSMLRRSRSVSSSRSRSNILNLKLP